MRLDPELDPKETERAIDSCAELLHDIPPARLYDEMIKLFMGGQALASYDMLQRYPSNVDLLFTSVLLHDANDDMPSSEQDLRRIIALEPDDARAPCLGRP